MKIIFPEGSAVYTTARGIQLCGDSRELLKHLPEESVDLIVTSPPFALLRQKAYGNVTQRDYVSWLLEFGREAKRVLRSTGSFVLDLGGAYRRGKPSRSLYNYRVLIEFCDTLGYQLAEEFFWYNPAKLPSPIEWVNKRKIRVKDAVDTIWWFSKDDFPRADVTQVLVPYSERMKKLLQNPDRFYKPGQRPSGHDISQAFANGRDGAIPSNLLEISNTASNSHYQRVCKLLGRQRHPARFPEDLPAFFIKFLTQPGDLVLDIFSGSNTTGYVAETLNRRWLSMEIDRSYAALSAIRFLDTDPDTTEALIESMEQGGCVSIDKVMIAKQESLFTS